jgi:Bromodomain
MPPLEGQEEPLKRMAKIVQALINYPDSGPFREPVDWRGLELFDYPEVVKRMIDLGTIARKLERNQYATAWECALDVRLVWKNCMSYNAEGSDFWLLAKSLSRKFEDRFRRLRQECKPKNSLQQQCIFSVYDTHF